MLLLISQLFIIIIVLTLSQDDTVDIPDLLIDVDDADEEPVKQKVVKNWPGTPCESRHVLTSQQVDYSLS